jgi:hypothetical protein
LISVFTTAKWSDSDEVPSANRYFARWTGTARKDFQGAHL